MLLGAVVDFLDFHSAAGHWPAFNVADSAITCGAVLLIWDGSGGEHEAPLRITSEVLAFTDILPMISQSTAKAIILPCKSCSPIPAVSAPASTARSRSSNARWQLHGAPIYVRHEVVHNKFVVDDLRAKGAVFVEDLDEVPAGAR